MGWEKASGAQQKTKVWLSFQENNSENSLSINPLDMKLRMELMFYIYSKLVAI